MSARHFSNEQDFSRCASHFHFFSDLLVLRVEILDDQAFIVGDDRDLMLHQVIHRPLDEFVAHTDAGATGIGLVNPMEENDQPQIVGNGIVNF